MNFIIRLLKESRLILFFRILRQTMYEAYVASKHLSGSGMSNDSNKLATPIQITAHALEKGMSIGNVRAGFGKEKAISLIKMLERYKEINGDDTMVNKTCKIIIEYINFNKQLNADVKNVEVAFIDFCKNKNVNPEGNGGVYTKSDRDTYNTLYSSFSCFSQSRFSIRDFGDKPISKESIKSALKMCERTPSACNRQRWHIYIYTNENKKNEIFKLQGGCNGFYKDMQAAILICSDMRGYGIQELHQAYVDGGLYAMNLLYCLHYQGLATIPLTMGNKLQKTKTFKKEMSIPEYEVPVILIGIGSFKESYRVAVSERNPYQNYCTFI